jgi:Ribbon-helix-helix domain
MPDDYKRLSVRSVKPDALQRLRVLRATIRIPLALLIEEGIDAVWDSYVAAGYDLEEPNQSRGS